MDWSHCIADAGTGKQVDITAEADKYINEKINERRCLAGRTRYHFRNGE
jgi:hypothetical protein